MAKKQTKTPKPKPYTPPPAKTGGRPPKIRPPARNLTRNVISRVCSHIRMGTHLEAACLAAGVTQVLVKQWLARANEAKLKPPAAHTEEEKLYLEFQEQINLAAGEAVARRMKRIERAGRRGEWKADAWALAHMDPERYGSKKTVEHTGNVTHQHAHAHLEVDVDDLPPEVVMKLYGRMKEQEEQARLAQQASDNEYGENLLTGDTGEEVLRPES